MSNLITLDILVDSDSTLKVEYDNEKGGFLARVQRNNLFIYVSAVKPTVKGALESLEHTILAEALGSLDK